MLTYTFQVTNEDGKDLIRQGKKDHIGGFLVFICEYLHLSPRATKGDPVSNKLID